jgi:exodeoxyribonuclease-3
MKIISWNVNGLRSLIKKHDLNDFFNKYKPDVFCMSEIKLSCPYFKVENELLDKVKGYKYRYWNVCTAKQGYSGVSVWCKKEPLSITYGIGKEKHDEEGRIITCEFDNFYLIQCYIPNSGQELKRLDYRVNEWDIEFRNYIKKLKKTKPVIIAGDLNVIHKEIDIHNLKRNKRSAGCTDEERESFNKLLNEGLIDTFRQLHPEKIKYSYWSNFGDARKNNKGWRLDYFLTSISITDNVKKSDIIDEMEGSDHAPITLSIKF